MDRNIHDKDENRLDFINKLREEISKIKISYTYTYHQQIFIPIVMRKYQRIAN